MKKHSKVEEQKGPINPNEEVMHMQTRDQQLRQAHEEAKMRRSYQTLTKHEPKR